MGDASGQEFIGAAVRRQVDKTSFDGIKLRIDKAVRIKNDLVPKLGESRNIQRVAEVRRIEQVSQQGVDVGKGYQEAFVDTRGYRQVETSISYISPSGETKDEILISFVKTGPDGKLQYLTNAQGKSIALNKDLYTARLVSNKHHQGRDYVVYTIPRVDAHGAYVGIYSLQFDNLHQVTQQTVAKDEVAQTTPSREEELLAKGEDIVKKLTRIYPSGVAGAGRLGKEINLTAEEQAVLFQTVQLGQDRIMNLPGIKDILNLINQYQGKDAAFDAIRAMGGLIVENPLSHGAGYSRDAKGIPHIEVPTDQFNHWQVYKSLIGIEYLLNNLMHNNTQQVQGALGPTIAGNIRAVLNAIK